MALSGLISRCISKWQAEGLVLAPPIAADEVRRVWSSFHQEVSSDVLLMYGTVGGFLDDVYDERFFWSLWPWDFLEKCNNESPCDGVAFCDHSLQIVTWELRYESPQHSSVWSSHGNRSAPTLEAFLGQYLDDPWQLL